MPAGWGEKAARWFARVTGRGAIGQGDRAAVSGAGGQTLGGQARVEGDVFGPAARVDKSLHVHNHVTGPASLNGISQEEARSLYLKMLRRQCLLLPLAALGGEESADADPLLDAVYIELDTTARRALTESERAALPDWQRERDPKRAVRAIEAFRDHSRIVLLGDAGSGKSAFVRNVMAWQCAQVLGLPAAKAVADGLDLGRLLPVLVPLRDLVPRLASLDLDRLDGDRRERALCQAIREQLADDLRSLDAEAFGDGLYQQLASGEVLLAFDGLDEVPESARGRVRDAVAAALRRWDVRRVVVTCRTRSYEGAGRIPGFEAFTLDSLDDSKIRAFVKGWYDELRRRKPFDSTRLSQRAAELTAAATGSDLRELASNPMLLTTMTLLHQRDVGLPKERVRVYRLAIEVLIQRWQKHRAGDVGIPSALLPVFDQAELLRRAMERLAYETHRLESQAGQASSRIDPAAQAAGDLTRGTAQTILGDNELGSAAVAEAFLDYVDQRAGLLIGRGGPPGKPSAYAFPHRTFQEYLAGSFLVTQGLGRASSAVRKHAEDGDFWSLAVALFGEEAALNRSVPYDLLNVAIRLCPVRSPASVGEWRAVLWSGRMAAVVGRKVVEAYRDDDDGPAYLERLIGRLESALGSELPAVERAEAGAVLANLGDHRAGVTSVDEMVFCDVPAGRFRMGSDENDALAVDDEKPAHEVEVPGFSIGRWPVTCAQFGHFVADGGYSNPGWWKDLRRPEGRELPPAGFDGANQPVVNVSWWEAIAFTRWLTARWRASGTIRPDQSVHLPSEAEWEKAARGGVTLPNGQQNRWLPYPWGAQLDPERANCAESGIGQTSAVGCFPKGASPCGAEDLLGNVWEWTRSERRAYPYRIDEGRERSTADPSTWLALRGGAFHDDHRVALSAARGGGRPELRLRLVGFRVIVSPP